MKYWIFFLVCLQSYASELTDRFPAPSIDRIYEYFAHLPVNACDIGEHMHLLKGLAAQCSTVTEIGLGGIVSTWGLLQGLSENQALQKIYIGIDIAVPPLDNLNLARRLAEETGISFTFLHANDLDLEIEPTDLLFIDSLHTYCHLTYELETFSPRVKKYIAMHDTSEPWGHRDDEEYHGNYTEYPPHYPRWKRGLWPAVHDFLKRHPEWALEKRHYNCHGFTILRRVQDDSSDTICDTTPVRQ